MFRIRAFSPHEQLAWMLQHGNGFKCLVKGGCLQCRGSVRPTPLSDTYSVSIQYRMGDRPKVLLPGGQLKRRIAEETIPHTYADDEPCLYYPGAREWRPDMKIAESVIGWLAHWLHYYEIWLASGEWLGGGIDHRSPGGK